MKRLALSLVIVLGRPAIAPAQADNALKAFTEGIVPETMVSVAIHPPAAGVICSQHSVHTGDPVFLGDAAGIDCTVIRRTGGASGRFPRAYERDGVANNDWYGWNAAVLAPFEGTVEDVHVNPVTNEPGAAGKGPASYVVFRRADGIRVVYGHVTAPTVAPGDRVTAGQVVARIGNNGFAWFPHLHLGAWRGREAAQIIIDPRALGTLEERQRAAGENP